jgi:hypothetical protein
MPSLPRDPRPPERAVLSTFVPRHDGARRLEQAIRLLLQPVPGAPPLQDRSTEHARRHLRPRLDQPPESRPDD